MYLLLEISFTLKTALGVNGLASVSPISSFIAIGAKGHVGLYNDLNRN